MTTAGKQSRNMQGIDWRLFRLINGLAGHFGPLDLLMKASTQYMEYVLLFLVATLWVTPGEDAGVNVRRQRIVVCAILAALLALGINKLIGLAWFRPRPFVFHHVTLLLPHANDPSFPSDHAAGGFALATTPLLARDRWTRRLGWLMLALACLLAFSRVYVGHHYPLDVIGGALIGTACAVGIYLARALIDPFLRLLLPLQRLTAIVMGRLKRRGWSVSAR